jgi:uncharacterized protein YjbJ (UPF0337 family)
MNKDELKGKMENLKGRAKEAIGSLSGNKEKQAEGMAERIKGAGQEKVGEAKREVSRDVSQDIEESDDE